MQWYMHVFMYACIIYCIYIYVLHHRSEYQSEAFLLSEEFTVLAGTLNCLDTIDFKYIHIHIPYMYIHMYVCNIINLFSLCLRDHNFDLGERREIDYSSYLVFQQRYVIYTYMIYTVHCICK